MVLLRLARAASSAALALAAFSAAASDPPKTLRVATRAVAPFAVHEDGRWSGLSIALWDHACEELGYQPAYYETSLQGMLDDAASGRADAAVGALTVTAEREARLDFTHPFYAAGLGIAVRPAGNVFTGLLRALVSWRFLTAVASLLMILLVAGALLWVFERRRNTEQFHPRPVRGLGDGLWWAAVTMTTVGYGDKAPATKGGRLVALVWMYASVIIISFFTAGIATSLTVGSLSSDIAGPGDLRGRPVGVITGSTGETTARQLRAKTAGFRGAPEALHALADGEVDAVVYDKPMLAYYAQSFPADAIRLLKGVIDRQDYAVALPPGSPLREPVNRAMLEYLNSAAWRDLQAEYLGEE